jgi:hypothetical protein
MTLNPCASIGICGSFCARIGAIALPRRCFRAYQTLSDPLVPSSSPSSWPHLCSGWPGPWSVPPSR